MLKEVRKAVAEHIEAYGIEREARMNRWRKVKAVSLPAVSFWCGCQWRPVKNRWLLSHDSPTTSLLDE
jgi:hypothetical protein